MLKLFLSYNFLKIYLDLIILYLQAELIYSTFEIIQCN